MLPRAALHDRLHSLQALRGVAVLLVVVYHLRHFAVRWCTIDGLPAWLVHFQAGVDLFFVISGYVMVHVATRSGQPASHPGAFLLKRAVRIYPLYWVFTVLAGTFLLARSGWVHPRSESLGEVLLGSLVLWPQTSAPLVGQGWSLVHEMYFYCTFALLLGGRRLAVTLVGWVALVAIGLVTFGPFDGDSVPLLRTVFHPLTFEFAAGAAIALLHQAGKLPLPAVSLLTGLALWLGSWTQGEFAQHGVPRVLCHGAAALLIVHGVVALERLRRLPSLPWLIAIGDASYSIYLSHLAVIVLLGQAWLRMLGQPTNSAAFALLICLLAAAAVGVGFGVWRFAEVPLQTLCSRCVRRTRSAPPISGET